MGFVKLGGICCVSRESGVRAVRAEKGSFFAGPLFAREKGFCLVTGMGACVRSWYMAARERLLSCNCLYWHHGLFFPACHPGAAVAKSAKGSLPSGYWFSTLYSLVVASPFISSLLERAQMLLQ